VVVVVVVEVEVEELRNTTEAAAALGEHTAGGEGSGLVAEGGEGERNRSAEVGAIVVGTGEWRVAVAVGPEVSGCMAAAAAVVDTRRGVGESVKVLGDRVVGMAEVSAVAEECEERTGAADNVVVVAAGSTVVQRTVVAVVGTAVVAEDTAVVAAAAAAEEYTAVGGTSEMKPGAAVLEARTRSGAGSTGDIAGEVTSRAKHTAEEVAQEK
jgi:hypothetical protein